MSSDQRTTKRDGEVGKGGIAKRGAYEVRGVSLLTYDTPHRRKTAEQSATDTTDGKQKKDNLSIILSGGA